MGLGAKPERLPQPLKQRSRRGKSKIRESKGTRFNKAAWMELLGLVNKLLLVEKPGDRCCLLLTFLLPLTDVWDIEAAVIVVDITGNLLLICGL